MLRPRTWIAVTALALVLFLGFCRFGAKNCSQCGRTECRNMAFTVHLQDGTEVETCCPRCGLHYLEGEHPAVRSLSAHDFYTAAKLPADRAFYVEGSDVTPCLAPGNPPVRDEHGCCAPVYDRCLPSLLAFSSRERAEAFAKEHGGTMKTFGEIGSSRP